MTQPTRMTRIYPEDVARLDAVRRGLQAIRLDDQTNADALSYLLDQHETAEAWMREHYGPATQPA